MKILHLLYDHPDNPWLAGGGAARAREINRRLVAGGDEVTGISGGFPGRSGDRRTEEGVEILTASSGKSYPASRLRYNLEVDRIARELLRKERFDLLVHDLSPFSHGSPWKYFRGPSVALLHNLIGKRLYSKMGPLALPFALREKGVLPRHTATIAVSEWLAESARSLGAPGVRTVYNGVDAAAFEGAEEPEPATVLFLGRIDLFQKGIDTLIRSMVAVRKEIPEAKLIIAGTGPDEEKVKRLAEEHLPGGVTFVGRLGGERFGLISRSTVVALPSRFEGWGIVAIEAAAAGRATVGTAVDGLQEAIEEGVTGLLVRRGTTGVEAEEETEREFAAALLRVLRDPALRRDLGEAGRRRAEHFRWDRIAEQQRQVYSEAIELFNRSATGR